MPSRSAVAAVSVGVAVRRLRTRHGDDTFASVRDLRVQVGRRGPQILHGINLDILPGETYGLVGESGSGKSTLLHLIGGPGRR